MPLFQVSTHLFLLAAMPDEEEGEEWVEGVRGREGVTFYSLREWTLWLLFSAIEHERDSTNLQLLLHGLLVCLQNTGEQ